MLELSVLLRYHVVLNRIGALSYRVIFRILDDFFFYEVQFAIQVAMLLDSPHLVFFFDLVPYLLRLLLCFLEKGGHIRG